VNESEDNLLFRLRLAFTDHRDERRGKGAAYLLSMV